MKLTEKQYNEIAPLLPRQRGHVKVDNERMLNAILYVAENGCKWRALPERFGNWQTVYRRTNRWARAGVLEKVFTFLQKKRMISVRVEFLALDSTCVKVHPDGTGALKKGVCNRLAKQKAETTQNFMWYPQMIRQS